MAIYHLHAKTISRGKGQSIVAAAAYRRAMRLFDEREGRWWDYTSKSNVVHREILIPANAASWLRPITTLEQDDARLAAERLWNLVEAKETRIDAQLAREIEFALPIELTREQNISLAKEFIQDQFVQHGMVADYSVHWDNGNPHVHVLLTMREITTLGFGRKVTEWNQKTLLQEWRQQWAAYANFHLQLHQHPARIDHRSYEAQGIDLIPTQHRGRAIGEMRKLGKSLERWDAIQETYRHNNERIREKPERLLNKLGFGQDCFDTKQIIHELQRYVFLPEPANTNYLSKENIEKVLKGIEYYDAVFTQRSLAKALLPYTDKAEHFAQALMQLKASSELVYLGLSPEGHEQFTTRRLFRLENKIQLLAEQLRKRGHLSISVKRREKLLIEYEQKEAKNLTLEQRIAVNRLIRNRAICCVVGRAGTGKSLLLGAANIIWQSHGVRVFGVALSGVAADNLQQGAGIQSRTIDAFRLGLEKGSVYLRQGDVVVMDEAGMTDSHGMHALLKNVVKARAKLVLVGDVQQLQPIGPGASFRAIVERVGFTDLQTIYRQKVDWQREATLAFSEGKIAQGLRAYDEAGHLHFKEDETAAIQQMIRHWYILRQRNPLNEILMLAHRNRDVSLLNERIRGERIQHGDLSHGHSIRTIQGEIQLSVGDRILFLKNDRNLKIRNGSFGTVADIHVNKQGRVVDITVLLDSQQSMRFSPKEYSQFTYGYAGTIHKAQGMTKDHTLVYLGGQCWNRHLTYVALSRHRESCQLYAAQTEYRDRSNLARSLARYALKDSVLDYPLAFMTRRDLLTENVVGHIKTHITKRLQTWQENLSKQFVSLGIKIRNEPKHSLSELLKAYIRDECKYHKLIGLRNQQRLNNPIKAKQYSNEAQQLGQLLMDKAKEISQHKDFQHEFWDIRKGSAAMYPRQTVKQLNERIQKGQFNIEEKVNILRHLAHRSDAFLQMMLQKKDQHWKI